jgi:spermidine/putrescine transport system substrate-binding protein
MYAKLKAGGTGYDIVMPSSYQVGTMAKEGMIDAIDAQKIPNVLKNFDHAFDAQILDPTFKYNVPYAVTYTGFMYAKDKMPKGVDVNTWKVLENPALKGKVTLLDDLREVIGAGLMSLGFSLNSTKPAEIEAAVREKIAAQRYAAWIKRLRAAAYIKIFK